MKILVFSDSHGALGKMKKAASLHPDCSMIIFLGDGLRDADNLFDEYKNIPTVAVRGNCDISALCAFENYLYEQTVDMGGVRIFCTHGHKYNAKSTKLYLQYRAQEKEADLCLFGHTHEQFESVSDGVRLFNPGSIGSGYYGIIYIENGALTTSHTKI